MSVQPEKNGVCDSSNGNHVLDFEHEGAVDGNMHLLVEWLNHILPDLNLPLEASVEDLRACLIDGTVLCSILNMLSPGLIEMRWDSDPGPDNVKKFLAAMDELDLSRFFLADIQEGYMVPVLQCLERLKSHFDNTGRKENILNHLRMRWNLPDIKSSERTDHYLEEKSSLYGERQRSSTNVKSPPRTIYSTVTSVDRQSLIATRKTSTSPYMSVQPAKNGVCDSSNGNHILDFEHEGTVDGNMRLLVEWLNHILPDLNLSLEASVEDLRACLIDGTVLCSILNKLSPGLIEMRGDSDPGPDKVKKFLAAMDELGLSMFVLEDMQEGYMVPVLQCLERLKSHFDNTDRKENILNHLRMRWNLPDIKSSERTDHYQEDTSPCAEKSSLYGEWQRSSTNVKSPPCTIYSTVTSESRQLSRADIWLKKLEKKPMEIYIDDEAKLTLHGLVQHYIKLTELEKNRKLNDLLDALDFNQIVIFVKSVNRVAELNKLLVECNFPSICIHYGMSLEERLMRYKGFKEGHKRILVATNLVGRGIDIEGVNIVINYDMPDSADTYLHRLGRPGRFGTKELSITFVSSSSDYEVLNQVQERFEVDIKELSENIDTSTQIGTVFRSRHMLDET